VGPDQWSALHGCWCSSTINPTPVYGLGRIVLVLVEPSSYLVVRYPGPDTVVWFWYSWADAAAMPPRMIRKVAKVFVVIPAVRLFSLKV
jgi:hypothetical protein